MSTRRLYKSLTTLGAFLAALGFVLFIIVVVMTVQEDRELGRGHYEDFHELGLFSQMRVGFLTRHGIMQGARRDELLYVDYDRPLIRRDAFNLYLNVYNSVFRGGSLHVNRFIFFPGTRLFALQYPARFRDDGGTVRSVVRHTELVPIYNSDSPMTKDDLRDFIFLKTGNRNNYLYRRVANLPLEDHEIVPRGYFFGILYRFSNSWWTITVTTFIVAPLVIVAYFLYNYVYTPKKRRKKESFS